MQVYEIEQLIYDQFLLKTLCMRCQGLDVDYGA